MNREPFDVGEYYHIYNRGVDKRNIFANHFDVDRFLKSMEYFNDVDPIISLYFLSFDEKPKDRLRNKLVDIIAFCLNPNHYHFILRERIKGGISEFMKRLNGGYTRYFNHRQKRSGALLQGRFKSKHIHTEEYLLRVSAYVNLNYRVHQLSGSTTELVRSSWGEYVHAVPYLCETSVILQQFSSIKEYEKFALEALPQMIERKDLEKDLKAIIAE